jgi:hypothetical protein
MGTLVEGVAREEDRILHAIADQGIFHMPEVAFAYACGKAIMTSREYVFGDISPIWKREAALGNGGPTDLVFELPGRKSVAVEFKVRDTSNAYIADLEKLLRLDQTKYQTLFCALVDTFSLSAADDERVAKVESFSRARIVSLLEPKPRFVTKQSRYQREVSCVIGFWAIQG